MDTTQNSTPLKRIISAGLSAILIVAISQAGFTNCLSYCSEGQWGYAYGIFDTYQITASTITLEGVEYDPSGLPINPQLIDRLTDEVQACLTTTIPNGIIPSDIKVQSNCTSDSVILPLDRKTFKVKVADDWLLNCDGTQQLLPVLAGNAGCIAKGLNPTADCPCRWRVGLKCPNEIIVTPSFYLYKDALIRFITSCKNPWGNTALSQCATPTTDPLSDGTGS